MATETVLQNGGADMD